MKLECGFHGGAADTGTASFRKTMCSQSSTSGMLQVLTGTEQLCCGNGNVWHDPSLVHGTLFSFKVLT